MSTHKICVYGEVREMCMQIPPQAMTYIVTATDKVIAQRIIYKKCLVLH